MQSIIIFIENFLNNNNETISINSLKEICRIYSIYNINDIINYFNNKNLLNNHKSKYLSNKLQIEFIKRIKNNDILAREVLIMTNYKLVAFLVDHIYSDSNYREDLIEYGLLGLMHAVDNFDININDNFSNYAGDCIKGMIKRYLPTTISTTKINKRIFFLNNIILKIEEKLIKELQKEKITNLEILNELQKNIKYNKLTEKEIDFIRKYSPSNQSFDKKLNSNSNDSYSLMDTLQAEDNVEETIINNDIYKIIHKIINKEIKTKLTDTELKVITLMYGFDKNGTIRTSKDVGKILNLTGVKVREINKISLKKLKNLNVLSNEYKNRVLFK